MKRCLIITANPSTSSFTHVLANEFRAGLNAEEYQHETINLFQEGYPGEPPSMVEVCYKELIEAADGVVFIFPVWCEMPPYPLVAFLQRIFNEGFAFKHVNGKKHLLIEKRCMLIQTMGQMKIFQNGFLHEALNYVGMYVRDEIICRKVGPNLSSDMADFYKEQAYNAGKNFLK